MAAAAAAGDGEPRQPVLTPPAGGTAADAVRSLIASARKSGGGHAAALTRCALTQCAVRRCPASPRGCQLHARCCSRGVSNIRCRGRMHRSRATIAAAVAAAAASATFAFAASVVPAVPLVAAVSGTADNNTCPAGTPVACGANGSCCSVLYSGPGFGCCPGIANAVCCGLQSCCPPGFTCLNTPPYSSVCVNATGEAAAKAPLGRARRRRRSRAAAAARTSMSATTATWRGAMAGRRTCTCAHAVGRGSWRCGASGAAAPRGRPQKPPAGGAGAAAGAAPVVPAAVAGGPDAGAPATTLPQQRRCPATRRTRRSRCPDPATVARRRRSQARFHRRKCARRAHSILPARLTCPPSSSLATASASGTRPLLQRR